jgi:chorismate mutase/prephenate dehydratase
VLVSQPIRSTFDRYSHPQPFQQCSQYLSRYPHWKIEYTEAPRRWKKWRRLTPDRRRAGQRSRRRAVRPAGAGTCQANQTQNITRFLVLAAKR